MTLNDADEAILGLDSAARSLADGSPAGEARDALAVAAVSTDGAVTPLLRAVLDVAGAALERLGATETKCAQLEEALLSRDVIGQAKGILMERHKTTPDGAFEILRDTSQHLNMKLRDVAARLAETGELPVA